MEQQQQNKKPKNDFAFAGFFIALYIFTAPLSFAQSKVQAPLIPHQTSTQTGLKFNVKGIETHGNIKAVQKDIHKIIQTTMGKKVGPLELQSLIMRIHNVYNLAGINANISIPLQNIKNGIIPVIIDTAAEEKTTSTETPKNTIITEEISPVTYHSAIEVIEDEHTVSITLTPEATSTTEVKIAATEVSETYVSKSMIKLKDTATIAPAPIKKEALKEKPKPKAAPQKADYNKRITGLEGTFKTLRKNAALNERGRNIFLLKTPPQKKTVKKVAPPPVIKKATPPPKQIIKPVAAPKRVDAKLGLPKPKPMFPEQMKYVEPKVDTKKMRIDRGL